MPDKKLAVALYRQLLKAAHACGSAGIPLVGVAGFGARPALNLAAVIRGAFLAPQIDHGSAHALTADDAFLALRRMQEQEHVLSRVEEGTREVGGRWGAVRLTQHTCSLATHALAAARSV
jgi:hypothetical protein